MHSPAPATRVSSMCCCDRVPSACTDAIPPWAQLVDPAASTSLVTTITVPRSRHSRAAVSPAMPEPMTTTSTSVIQPGGSAASRCGSEGSGDTSGKVGDSAAPAGGGSKSTSGSMVDMLPHDFEGGTTPPDPPAPAGPWEGGTTPSDPHAWASGRTAGPGAPRTGALLVPRVGGVGVRHCRFLAGARSRRPLPDGRGQHRAHRRPGRADRSPAAEDRSGGRRRRRGWPVAGCAGRAAARSSTRRR